VTLDVRDSLLVFLAHLVDLLLWAGVATVIGLWGYRRRCSGSFDAVLGVGCFKPLAPQFFCPLSNLVSVDLGLRLVTESSGSRSSFLDATVAAGRFFEGCSVSSSPSPLLRLEVFTGI
jgi:hypothetical protein